MSRPLFLLFLAALCLAGCLRGFESQSSLGIRADAVPVPTPDAASDAADDLPDLGEPPDLPDLGDLGALGDLGVWCSCDVADLDGDGGVNLLDFELLKSCLGKPAAEECATSDLNGNEIVDPQDFSCLKALIGQGC